MATPPPSWPGPERDAGPGSGSGLADPAAAALLARDGYVRLGQLLDDDEVSAALAIFDEAQVRLGQPIGDRWFPTILYQDDDVRAFITDRLGEIVTPKLAGMFTPGELELVRLDYSVKPPSDQSELGPHQDYALIDEHRYQSLYLWIPLVDTDEVNGTLHVVPGSHHFGNRIRSRHVPAYFDEVLDLVHESSTRLDCRAGELVVMVSGVIHHSPVNASGRLRLAAHGILKPAEAPIVFYFADEDTPAGQVECYELDIEQYVHAIHHGRPVGVPVSRYQDHPVPHMDRERFRRGMADRPMSTDGPR